jgi:hypothetical protein
MKMMWFHLMPYPALPEDFNKKHRSVWVDIDPALFRPEVMAETYDTYIDQLVYAEECGFDGICVNEHHNNGYGLMPSPNLIASILANRTSRAAITVLGNSVALYNPPIRVADVGTSMDTAYSYSVNPSQLRPKYYEGIELIMKAWQAKEPFAFNGKFNQLRYVNPVPRPWQQPHPPVWIPGGGSVETWDFCAKNDFVYGALTYYGYKMVRETVKGYWAWPTPMRRRTSSTKNRPSTSSIGRCTCTPASPIRPAMSPRPRCVPATRARFVRPLARSRPSTISRGPKWSTMGTS